MMEFRGKSISGKWVEFTFVDCPTHAWTDYVILKNRRNSPIILADTIELRIAYEPYNGLYTNEVIKINNEFFRLELSGGIRLSRNLIKRNKDILLFKIEDVIFSFIDILDCDGENLYTTKIMHKPLKIGDEKLYTGYRHTDNRTLLFDRDETEFGVIENCKGVWMIKGKELDTYGLVRRD